MSKKDRLHYEWIDLLEIIKDHPNGISLNEIKQHLPRISQRTLQRRLAKLIEQGELIKTDRARKTRYCPIQDANPKLHLVSRLSQALIKQPLNARSPTQYNPNFLNDYHPNTTMYLPEATREHLQKIGTPFTNHKPAGTYAKEILSRLLIDLSWNSSRLEGNTYSLLETEQLIKFGEFAENKNSLDAQMILNHKNAIEFLVDTANDIDFNPFTIFNLHALLSDNLLGNPEACGKLRRIIVAIHGTTYQPLAIPQIIEEKFYQLLKKAISIKNPFEQGFFVMVHLPYLQPFEDVNKRVSRLAANIPLIKHNLCPLSFINVSEKDYIDAMLCVYEFNEINLLRDLFVWAYECSAKRYSLVQHSIGQPDPFKLRYHVELNAMINLIIKQKVNRKKAIAFIQQWTTHHIASKDHAQFIETVETELLGLHAGNIARYRLRLDEFEKWRKVFQ